MAMLVITRGCIYRTYPLPGFPTWEDHKLCLEHGICQSFSRSFQSLQFPNEIQRMSCNDLKHHSKNWQEWRYLSCVWRLTLRIFIALIERRVRRPTMGESPTTYFSPYGQVGMTSTIHKLALFESRALTTAKDYILYDMCFPFGLCWLMSPLWLVSYCHSHENDPNA